MSKQSKATVSPEILQVIEDLQDGCLALWRENEKLQEVNVIQTAIIRGLVRKYSQDQTALMQLVSGLKSNKDSLEDIVRGFVMGAKDK